MNFLYPLGFAFAAVLALIVLMYLLKLRRQRMVISSILLWRKSLEDLQANAPFQKLRNNLLLWLQLLAAALAVVALARPIMKLAGLRGQSYVALVDTSASMKTREIEGRRIDLARAALDTLINDLSRGDEMMIVAFDREPRVVQTFSADKQALRAAADGLDARDAVSLAYGPLSLARAMAEKSGREVEVVLFSDGAIADLDRSPEGMPPVRFVPIGKTGENLGIAELDLRETFDREPDTQLFATVQNFGQARAQTLLECYLDGRLGDAKEINLGGGERTSVLFSGLRGKAGQLELRLKNADPLEADNVVHGVLARSEEIKILLVSSGNFFLEKLFTRNPRHKLFKTAPGEYKSSQGYALTVFDNFAPAKLEPGSYLFFNALPPLEGFSAGAEPLVQPAIIDWNRVHPLTRYVNFELVNIGKAIDVTAPSWIHTLAEGEISPLVFALERDQRQAVVVAFDLFESDWPLRVSFPIFIANAVNWLTGARFSEQAFSHTAGSTIPFAPRAGEKEVVIQTPSGQKKTLDFSEGRTVFFAQTDEIGFYRAKTGDEERLFAVNLLSPAESNIAPKGELVLRDQEVRGDTQVLKSNREVWAWFALAALAVLLLEWLIYCRRACL